MATGEIGTIYLLHFDRPYMHACHYLGWARSLDARLAHHAKGSGARLTAAVAAAGIHWTVARTWQGTRTDERTLHDYKHNPKLCPICAGERALKDHKEFDHDVPDQTTIPY